MNVFRFICVVMPVFFLAACIYIVNDSPGDRSVVRATRSPDITTPACAAFVAPEMDPEPLVPDITNDAYKDRQRVEELLANHIQLVRQWGLNYQAKVKEAASAHQLSCR